MVSLDLADAVATVVTALNANFSAVPVAVNGSDTRGGYTGTKPDIEAVYGEGGRLRKRRIDLDRIPAKSIVFVYEVSDVENETTVDEQFADVNIRVSIDIRSRISRAKLHELYNELRRIIMKVRTTIGGNYTYIKRLGKTDLTNKRTGIFRYVFDVELVKVSDFVGHS